MSKNLTPPTWYDKIGNEINIFDNTTYASNGPSNTAIGTNAVAGYSNSLPTSSALAIGYQAKATANSSIAIGSYDETGDNGDTKAEGNGSIAIGAGAKTYSNSKGGIAIGRRASSEQGGIAIGTGARSIGDNIIQLGNNNTAYTLNVGKKKYIPGLFDFDSLPKYESSGNTVSDKMRVSGLTTGLYIAYVRIILNEPASSNKFDCRGYKIFDIVDSGYNLPNVKAYQICSVNASLVYLESATVDISLIVSGTLARININKTNYLPISGDEVVFQVYKLSY